MSYLKRLKEEVFISLQMNTSWLKMIIGMTTHHWRTAGSPSEKCCESVHQRLTYRKQGGKKIKCMPPPGDVMLAWCMQHKNRTLISPPMRVLLFSFSIVCWCTEDERALKPRTSRTNRPVHKATSFLTVPLRTPQLPNHTCQCTHVPSLVSTQCFLQTNTFFISTVFSEMLPLLRIEPPCTYMLTYSLVFMFSPQPFNAIDSVEVS